MPRGQLNTNGSTPLADTVGGTAGTVTGTERAKLQALGTLLSASLGVDTALVQSAPYTTLLSVALTAGTWLVWGQVSYKNPSGATGWINARLRDATTAAIAAAASSQAAASAYDQVILAPVVIVATGAETVNLDANYLTGGGALTAVFQNRVTEGPATYLRAMRVL